MNTRKNRRPGQCALRKGRRDLPGQIYLITTITHQRQPFFANLYWARSVIRSLHHPQAAGDSRWLAWVLMPDHFHGLLELGESDTLARAMNRFKGRSARALNAVRGVTGTVWQRSFFDRAMRHDEDIRVAARYLVANPLRAGLVEHIGDYPHWDAVWL